MKAVDFEAVQIAALADRDHERAARLAQALPDGGSVDAIEPCRIKDYEFDYVVVCSEAFLDEMLQNLEDEQIPRNRIACWPAGSAFPAEGPLGKAINAYFEKEHRNTQTLALLTKRDFYKPLIISDMLNLHRPRNIEQFFRKSQRDYVRISTLELLAEQIKKRNVPGDLAEVGVFQGEISALMNEMFPQKRLYLFDTFEGFDESDLEHDAKNGFSDARDAGNFFKNTSVELVLRKMKFPEQCVVKKGTFPESLGDMKRDTDIRFSLVSIDPDLYLPTYEGIKYFYPRLSKGGYIIVHDYECPNFRGAREAIDNACMELGINFVPVSDQNGSVIIAK